MTAELDTTESIRVVIVDDHEMVRKGLATFLRVMSDLELVGGSVVVTGMIAAYAEYQDQRQATAQLQTERATAAVSLIELFFTDTMRIVEAAIPPTPAPRGRIVAVSDRGTSDRPTHSGLQVARERTEHELFIAREIQLSLLPRALPLMHGWRVKAHHQPPTTLG